MTALSPAVWNLWLFGMLVQACLLVVLLCRQGYRQYPAFSLFIGFCVVRSTVLLYLAHRAIWLCTPVKWAAYVPQLIILVMVVVEVFHVVFHPYDTLPRGTVTHFVEATAAVAVVAVALAILFPGAEPKTWLRFARAMDQATSWVLCAVFGFIAIFSSYFGIPWRHRVFGIGLGFLFYLSVDVAVTTIVAHYGPTVFGTVWWVDMVAFLLACVIWGVYFGTAEAPRRVPTMDDFRRIQGALRRAAPVIERTNLN